MFSLNKVTLMGVLGRDPEIKKTQSGKDIAIFSVATSDSWKDKQTGEWQKNTEWHNIVVLSERLVDHVATRLKKGSKVLVEGSIKTSTYKDKDGAERKKMDIIVDSFKGSITFIDSQTDASKSSHFKIDNNTASAILKNHNLSDEIPF
jgi:single-strand DNA-binding protein